MYTKGKYYLGRILKMGRLDSATLHQCILNPSVLEKRKFNWTITDVSEGNVDNTQFLFGKLTKYTQEGHIKKVDIIQHSEIDELTSNLIIASSPFVYIPQYSGIIYLHVWNFIQEETFRSMFKKIIEETMENFFTDCTIEQISDYKTFITKISSLKKIKEISATVHPPNPLFGRLWESLNDYIAKRKTDEVLIKEKTNNKEGINTKIKELLNNILEDSSYIPQDVPDIADAALLMAADGYGRGKLIGENDDSEVVISTGDTQKSLLFAKEPVPFELAKKAIELLENINKERDMKHAK